ncbi:MFS transporter [Thalassobaculum sp.]|uniref:MFS transporter n=1 Tax=Thalassobaculum sp. TaxID=2022740 RepID=UPI0032EAA1C5
MTVFPAGLDPSAIRLALFYTAYFAVTGFLLPYWPAWLESRGLDPVTIGAVLSVGFWIKLVAHPGMAAVADATGALRGLTIALAAASFVVFAGFGLADTPWHYLALAALVGITFQSIMPLGEALALAEIKARKLDYGRIRIWGSVSFMAMAALGGWAIDHFQAPVILPLVLVTLVGLIVAGIALPKRRVETRRPWSWSAAARLALDRRFLIFVIAAGAAQASHSVFYGFGTIAWRRIGFDDTVIGLLWTLGVVAEIVLFWLAARLGRFGSATFLLAAAGVGAVVRWPLTAIADTVAMAAVLQLLHALTFGAAHLGAMRYLQDNAPPGLEATAQALYYALVTGVLMGLSMPFAGVLYQRIGMDAYHAMGVLGLIGLAATAVLARIAPLPTDRTT